MYFDIPFFFHFLTKNLERKNKGEENRETKNHRGNTDKVKCKNSEEFDSLYSIIFEEVKVLSMP